MNSARLLRLAEILDDVPPERFDLWLYSSDDCGTVACALGHAAVDREFNREGFKLELIDDYLQPVYCGEKGVLAAKRFFDLEGGVLGRLFYSTQARQTYGCGSSMVTPKMVAETIRKTVKEAA